MKPRFGIQTRNFTTLIALVVGPALIAGSAFAADQTYDATHPSNVWDTMTVNWDGSTAAWTNGNNATFSGTGESVAVDGAIIVANTTFSSGGFTIAPGTGSLSLAAGANTVNASAGTSTISSLIGGNGGINKTGTGRLDLTNAGNTFSGGFTATAGDTYVAGVGTGTAGAPTAGALGTGTVTLAGGRLVHSAGATIYNNILAQSSTNSTILQTNVGNNFDIHGSISGSGNITLDSNSSGAGGTRLFGDNSGFTGTLTVGGNGSARHKFASAAAGSTGAKFVLNGPTDNGSLLFGNGTIHFGELSGNGNQIRNNVGGATVSTISVGALGTSSTWAGVITNVGTIALTKVGAGTLTVSNTNTYNGATTVNGGIFDLTGSIANSPVTVNNGGTLSVGGSGKTLNALSVTAGGIANVSAVSTVSNAMSATGANATVNLANGSAGALAVNGGGGLTLGGAEPTDVANLQLDVGASGRDEINVTSGLVVNQGGASITINNLGGLAAGQSHPLLRFANGSGDGFATGTGVTVGSLTLANPSLSFGVSGQLEVTSTGVNLVTTGAVAPASAYWSGAHGSQWNSTSGGNANFTTTAAGGTFLNVLPSSNTQIFFSNNSPANLTHTLGANFDVRGLTYRGGSAAVTTTGASALTLQDGGITVESGNGGATLGMSNLVLGDDQTWVNNSSHPLVVSAGTTTGPLAWLTLEGPGGVELGGASLSAQFLEVNTDLDLKGTAVTAGLIDSSGTITTTGANATFTANLSSNATFSGTLMDVGTDLLAFTKTGPGTLSLSAANENTGVTTISGGILEFLGQNTMSFFSPLTLANGGTLGLRSDSTDVFLPAAFNSLTGGGTHGIAVNSLTGAGDGLTLSIAAPAAGGGANANTTLNVSSDTGNDLEFTTTFQTNSNSGGAWSTTAQNIFNLTGADVTLNGLAMGNNGNGGVTVNSAAGNALTLNGVVTTNNNRTSAGIVNSGTLTLNNTISVNTGQPNWGFFVILNGGTLNVNNADAIRNNAAPGGPGNRAGLTLAGGTIDNTNGAPVTLTGNPTVRINGDFAVSTPSGSADHSLNLGTGAADLGTTEGSTRTINVNGAATLTLGGVIGNGTTANSIAKTGAGTLNLTGANTYTGDTIVSGGVLAVDGDALPDSGKLVIDGGKVDPSGAVEVVGTLYFGDVQQAAGTWGASGSGAAHIDDTRFTGSGVVSVTTGAAGGYSTWAATNAPTGTAADDHDGDGVPNGVEYLLGGLATTNDIDKLPTLATTGGNVVFTFVRDQDAKTGDVTATIEVGTNLATWPSSYAVPNDPVVANPGVTVVDNGDGTDTVTLTIPQAPDAKKFARLVVVVD